MKKFSMLKLLVVLAIVSVFKGCGCKDKEYLYLSQDFKECHVFSVGSWWVYSINNNRFDTLAVIASYLKPPAETSYNSCEFMEYFSDQMNSTLYGNYYYEHGCFYLNRNSQTNPDTIYSSLCFSNWNINESVYTSENFSSSYTWYFGNGLFGMKNINELSKIDQISSADGYWLERISDTLVSNVTRKLLIFRTYDFNELEMEIQKNVDFLPPFRVYYASGIGLIRKEMYNGDIWELQDYFINN